MISEIIRIFYLFLLGPSQADKLYTELQKTEFPKELNKLYDKVTNFLSTYYLLPITFMQDVQKRLNIDISTLNFLIEEGDYKILDFNEAIERLNNLLNDNKKTIEEKEQKITEYEKKMKKLD